MENDFIKSFPSKAFLNPFFANNRLNFRTCFRINRIMSDSIYNKKRGRTRFDEVDKRQLYAKNDY